MHSIDKVSTFYYTGGSMNKHTFSTLSTLTVAQMIYEVLQKSRVPIGDYLPILDTVRAAVTVLPETDPLSRVVHNWAYLYDRERTEPDSSVSCLPLHRALGLHDGRSSRVPQENDTTPGTACQTA